MQKLILKCDLSPGDVVTMTAAVRDLHAAFPREYLTDVRTPCPALWMHNPHVTPIVDGDPDARVIEMHYPLIQKSNQLPYHFIHGYRMHLEKELGRVIPAGAFRGDIYVSDEERSWMSQVEEIEGVGTRYWIIVAGGKRDFTAKWWETERYQAVVDRFAGRIRFVQVGEATHHHPALRGVLDLRGKTDLRQLVRLVYHADGVLCPVTSLMHLAAAVPVRVGERAIRPCVVVAGGREPVQWEAYPGHRYLDTIGALPCCENGGCWKSRVVAVGDGDKKDESLCVRPVRTASGQMIPQCLDLVTVDDVVRAVESYMAASLVVESKGREAEGAAMKSKEAPEPTQKPCRKCGSNGGVPKNGTQKPDDARVWGPRKWAELHRRAGNCDLKKEGAWLAKFARTLPCKECAEHFAALLLETPPDLSSEDAYYAWTVAVHNLVNRKLGKLDKTLTDALKNREVIKGVEARFLICRSCEHYQGPTAVSGARCAKVEGGLKAFRGQPANACPIEKWKNLMGKKSSFSIRSKTNKSVGLVIGTYGAVPYVHLQLESLRRFHPGTPCLVVDDCSHKKEELAELCGHYGVRFFANSERRGHVPGDMLAFINGMEWAAKHELDILIKFSRRWIPIAPWIEGMLTVAEEDNATTMCSYCTSHGFGFRSECVGMNTKAWINTDAMRVIREHLKMCDGRPGDQACHHSGILVEHVIHMAAAQAKLALANPPHENFAQWPWMGTTRTRPNEGILWHETHSQSAYLAVLKAWNISRYSIDDLFDPKGNIPK